MRDLDCIGRNLHWLALGAAVALVGSLAFAPHARAAEPTLKDVEKHTYELEKRIEDIEINLAAAVAKMPATTEIIDPLKKRCPPPEDYGHSFEDCMAKQGRFNMTKAEVESRLYSMWECGHNQGIRWHNDP